MGAGIMWWCNSHAMVSCLQYNLKIYQWELELIALGTVILMGWIFHIAERRPLKSCGELYKQIREKTVTHVGCPTLSPGRIFQEAVWQSGFCAHGTETNGSKSYPMIPFSQGPHHIHPEGLYFSDSHRFFWFATDKWRLPYRYWGIHKINISLNSPYQCATFKWGRQASWISPYSLTLLLLTVQEFLPPSTQPHL